jgi:hypothetical protein
LKRLAVRPATETHRPGAGSHSSMRFPSGSRAHELAVRTVLDLIFHLDFALAKLRQHRVQVTRPKFNMKETGSPKYSVSAANMPRMVAPPLGRTIVPPR